MSAKGERWSKSYKWSELRVCGMYIGTLHRGVKLGVIRQAKNTGRGPRWQVLNFPCLNQDTARELSQSISALGRLEERTRPAWRSASSAVAYASTKDMLAVFNGEKPK